MLLLFVKLLLLVFSLLWLLLAAVVDVAADVVEETARAGAMSKSTAVSPSATR